MQYIIKQGDNLWNLAKKYLGNGVKYTEIMKANNWTNSNQLIKPGDVIIIPIPETSEKKKEKSKVTTSNNTPVTDVYLTAIKNVPTKYITSTITSPEGQERPWEDVLRENPDYQIYTDINGRPLTYKEFQQLGGDKIIPKTDKQIQSDWRNMFIPAYDNPIFGQRRVDNYNKASKRAEIKKNLGLPSYLDTMREGQDIAANTAFALFTYPQLIGQIANGVGEAYAAGELLPYTGRFLAGAVGAGAGGYAFDKAVYNATGKSFTQALTDNGVWHINAPMLNAGSWAGSGLASKVAGNFPAVFSGADRMTITPEGPVMVKPGETVIINNVKGIPGGNTVSATGYSYQRSFGKPHSGSFGNHKVSSGGGVRNQGKTTGYGYEPYSETGVRTGKGQDFFEYTNEFPIYDNPAIYLPAGFLMKNGPYYGSFPEVTVMGDVPRYEEYSGAKSPWELWYAVQPEGTVQTYTGADRPGVYLINRSGNMQTERRRVGNSQGWVAPDSTTYQYVTVSPRDEVNRLNGRMNPNATISKVEKIDISRAKNK